MKDENIPLVLGGVVFELMAIGLAATGTNGALLFAMMIWIIGILFFAFGIEWESK